MALQLVGNKGTIAEVESGSLALTSTLYPPDVGMLGSFGIIGTSGTMAAGLTAASLVFGFQWNSAVTIAIVTRVMFQAWGLGTGFAAGLGSFKLTTSRAFSGQSFSAGAAINPTKYKTNFSTAKTDVLMGSSTIMISTTGAVTTGGTFDPDPLGVLMGPCSATGNALIVGVPGMAALFDARFNEHPLVMAGNSSEAFGITATVPATGTWAFSVGVYWDEVLTY